jgi:SAM-dependent methyltransferase
MNDLLQETKSGLPPVEQWISSDVLSSIYSSSYWNNIEEERKKEWWIGDGKYNVCIDYLRNSGLLDEWAVAEKFISNRSSGNIKLEVADLAAGIGWTSALFSRIDNIAAVHAVEVSKHRLIDLFPHAVKMLDGNPAKIKRYIGSFYELGFKNESMDIIFLSQAFHHSDQPLKLLLEIDRVTKKGGAVILLGENYISIYEQTKRIARRLIKEGRVSMDFYENFPPDDVTGDHYYRVSDYYMFFRLLGYKPSHRIVNKRSLVFIAIKARA